jgi:SPX domain protein involved in polyphosphate accumulation
LGRGRYGLVPEKFVFVERKTHHEDWVGEGSVKERFQLKTSHAHAYFHSDEPLDSAFERLVAKGKMERKEADKSIALAREVKHLHSAMKLKASIRSIYRRTAFQQADSNKVGALD